MDESAWNCGRNGSKPLTKFWAERFLVCPNDPHGEPQKKTLDTTQTRNPTIDSSETDKAKDDAEPEFSMNGMRGSWIPYGGGPRACPGRHFAKWEIMMTCALIVSIFDVEILADEVALEMNPADYGLGTLRPVDKVPFRIRRRID